jgi:hypothetical protein
MSKYDDASWHYEGEYPEELPPENAATHIGMFITWCIENNLMSDEQMEECAEEIEQIKNREMTGAEFLSIVCDEKFIDSDLSNLGQAFANDYYEPNTNFSKEYNFYLTDYCEVFEEKEQASGINYETYYHVENSWENYDLVKIRIQQRFEEWLRQNPGAAENTAC